MSGGRRRSHSEKETPLMSGRRNLRNGGSLCTRTLDRRACSVAFEPLEDRRLFCDQTHLVDMTFWGLTGANTPGQASNGPIIAAEAAAPAVASSLGCPGAAPATPAALPILNSVPGAPTSVYLDFD